MHTLASGVNFCLNNLLLLAFVWFQGSPSLYRGKEKLSSAVSSSSLLLLLLLDLLEQSDTEGTGSFLLFHPVWCIHLLKMWVTVYVYGGLLFPLQSKIITLRWNVCL